MSTGKSIDRLKLAAIGVALTGAAIVGTSATAAAVPPTPPTPPTPPRPTIVVPSPSSTPSGTPSDTPSGTPSGESGSPSTGSQVGIIGVAALGAGLLPLGAWLWQRRRRAERG